MPRTLNRRAAFKSAPSKLATLTRRFHHRCTRIAAAPTLSPLFFPLSLCRSVFLFLVFSPAVVFIFFVRPFESNRSNDRLENSAKHRRIPLANVRLYEATAETFDRAFALANRSKEFGETRVNLLRAYICTYYIGAG